LFAVKKTDNTDTDLTAASTLLCVK